MKFITLASATPHHGINGHDSGTTTSCTKSKSTTAAPVAITDVAPGCLIALGLNHIN
jgi:hypothetical protein